MNMELTLFITNFSELFEETNPEQVKEDTVFKDLEEWSSLMALSLIAMVDENYNVKLKGVDIKDSETIKDLSEIIKSRL